jgi:aspartyl protease family protein
MEDTMRSLLIGSILVALVAIAMPRMFTYYVERPRANSVSTEVDSGDGAVVEGESAGGSAASRQVSIEADRDGHFYVDAEVNARPVRLMVDTGATVVALRQSDAVSAGIRLVPADFTNPVQTANGTTMAAETKIDSIMVEDIEVQQVRALVIPDDQLSISLLGGSFLNGLERFEVADGTLIFEN